jgi:palmitoyltransferase
VIVFASSRTAASYVRSSSRIVVVVARVVVVRFVSMFRFDSTRASPSAREFDAVEFRGLFLSRDSPRRRSRRGRARARRAIARAAGGRGGLVVLYSESVVFKESLVRVESRTVERVVTPRRCEDGARTPRRARSRRARVAAVARTRFQRRARAMASPARRTRETDDATVNAMGGDRNVFASRACDACRALGSFMVLVVLAIVGLTYYATVVVVYGPLAAEGGEDAGLATGALCAYHVFAFMLLWSYFACVLTAPGDVPRGWTPAPEDPEEAASEAKKSNSEKRRRFCKKCAAWKPTRTHHCSVCKRCVLKMDHHCVWVANCVGAYNYKFFLQFLAYTFLATVLDAILLLSNFIDFFKDVEESQAAGSQGADAKVDPAEGTELAVVFVTFIVNVAFSASLLGFLVMHGNLILSNMTTIEMYEKKKTLPWKYDLGRFRNFKEVFGENVFMWFLPVHSSSHLEKMRVNTGISDGECLEGAAYARACESAQREATIGNRKGRA